MLKVVRSVSPLMLKQATLPEAGWSVVAAHKALEALNLELAARPVDEAGVPILPEMPADLDQATIGEVVRLLGQYTMLAGYVEEQLALHDSFAAEAAIVCDNVKARVHVTKGGTVADKAAKVENDPGYLDALATATEKAAVARLIKAKLKSAERCISALSRAQSAKEAELNRGFR